MASASGTGEHRCVRAPIKSGPDISDFLASDLMPLGNQSLALGRRFSLQVEQDGWHPSLAGTFVYALFQRSMTITTNGFLLHDAMSAVRNSGPRARPSAAALRRNISSPQAVLQETKYSVSERQPP